MILRDLLGDFRLVAGVEQLARFGVLVQADHGLGVVRHLGRRRLVGVDGLPELAGGGEDASVDVRIGLTLQDANVVAADHHADVRLAKARNEHLVLDLNLDVRRRGREPVLDGPAVAELEGIDGLDFQDGVVVAVESRLAVLE